MSICTPSAPSSSTHGANHCSAVGPAKLRAGAAPAPAPSLPTPAPHPRYQPRAVRASVASGSMPSSRSETPLRSAVKAAEYSQFGAARAALAPRR